MTEFPTKGDNFRTVGPWRILEGEGWQRWRTMAIAAEIAASESSGDMIARARLVLELHARKCEHPDRGSSPSVPAHDPAALVPRLPKGQGSTALRPPEPASDA